jgi:hypothetical protein
MRARRQITTLAAAALAAAVLTAPAAAQTGAGGCGWTEFTRLPGLSTYPDTGTQIYQCIYSAGPLHETVIEGRPPSARYWSFAVLDQARREVDNISDYEVQLEADGSYRIRVALDCAGAPNCLDLSTAPAPLVPERIFYRVYVPEGDEHGGPLPEVTYRLSAGPDERVALVDDGTLAAYFSELTGPLVAGGSVAEALARPSGLEQPASGDAPDPQAERFRGLGARQVDMLEQRGVPSAVIQPLREALGTGGFGATRDNAYVTIQQDMRLGNLVVRAKAPTYRAQSPTPANSNGRGDGSEQVRYWSLCTTQGTRPVDCVRDENVPLDTSGYLEVVLSPSCPVAGHQTCLRTGVLSATGSPASSLIYRNNLASASFYNELGPGVCPSPETMFCGEYKPLAHYVARP